MCMKPDLLSKHCPLAVGFAVPGDGDAALTLFRSLIGTPYCTWNEEYPDEETVLCDIAAGRTLLCRDGKGAAAVLVLLPPDELPPLPLWDADVRAPVLFARLGVRTDWQRKGVARALMLYAMEHVKSCGADGVRLIADKSNVAALALYASLGFTCAGEATLFANDWVCLERRL